MKTSAMPVFCLFLGITSTALSQVGATAESITIHPGAVNAYTYHHCRVIKVEPDGVRIAYDRGTAHIPHKFMPPEWLGAQGMPQPQSQPPQSHMLPRHLLPGQDLAPSDPPPALGFDNTLKEPGTSDNPNVSIPFGYFIPVNLADLRIDTPKGWLDGITNIDGKVYIPSPSHKVSVRENVTGWYGKRRFFRPSLPFVPYYTDLLFKSIQFKKDRAYYLPGYCQLYVHLGMATEAQAAEWLRLVSEERICVGMPAEIAWYAFGGDKLQFMADGTVKVGNFLGWAVYYRDDEPEKYKGWGARVVKWEKWDATSTPGKPAPGQNATVVPPSPPQAPAQGSASNRL